MVVLVTSSTSPASSCSTSIAVAFRLKYAAMVAYYSCSF